MLEVGALGGHFVGAGFSGVENLRAEFGAGGAEEVGFLGYRLAVFSSREVKRLKRFGFQLGKRKLKAY